MNDLVVDRDELKIRVKTASGRSKIPGNNASAWHPIAIASSCSSRRNTKCTTTAALNYTHSTQQSSTLVFDQRVHHRSSDREYRSRGITDVYQHI
jgi:hypothetical protein